MDHNFPPSFPPHLAEKHAAPVLQVAHEHGMSPTITDAVRALPARARSLGHGDEDVAAIYEAMATA
ncbi:MAG TPA: hypothetical protein VMV23_10050 [Candidatus Nanopelagicaceae bacterium]|nr:hypothetical protein [Candidatus Nanopelagicaceae bacterium]